MARRVAARPAQACDEAELDRVPTRFEDDRNGPSHRSMLAGQEHGRTMPLTHRLCIGFGIDRNKGTTRLEVHTVQFRHVVRVRETVFA